MSIIIYCTIGVILIVAIISVVLVIRMCSKKHSDEISLIEMPLSTHLMTNYPDPVFPSPTDETDPTSEWTHVASGSKHVDSGAEASPLHHNMSDAIESGRCCACCFGVQE
jgi:hypothetical protein